MCGICGITARPGENVALATVETMAMTLGHRGPDDQGAWHSPDGRVGFGHRRLSIIDLSAAGHQPMHDASSALTVAFNGEIYNFIELRRELASFGRTFRTATDTEVILEAYGQWGLHFVEHLNGMFAIALHDRENDRVVLARDRAGEKPLFYSHASGRLSFASELKALMANPSFQARLEPRALNAYLAYGYVAGPLSILRDVYKLPQGHLLTYDLRIDRLATWPYWRLPAAPSNGRRGVADDALVDELEALLVDSVRMRLIADVPVGIMLSGGVDSSLVTAMAARASTKRVKTFTISFPGHATFDEAPHARTVARHFGTDHVELAVQPATVDLLPLLARQYDEPLADSSMVPTYLFETDSQQPPSPSAATAATSCSAATATTPGSSASSASATCSPAPLRRAVAPQPRCCHRAPADALSVGCGGEPSSPRSGEPLFRPRDAPGLLAPSASRRRANRRTRKPRSTPIQVRAPARDCRRLPDLLVDDILVKVDRASMLASLSAACCSIRASSSSPMGALDHLRSLNGTRKVLLRRLAQRVLPRELDITRKQGFAIPLDRWFCGDWGALFRDVLGASRHFDRAVIQRLLAGQKLGLVNSHRIFALTMFELWTREYNVSL